MLRRLALATMVAVVSAVGAVKFVDAMHLFDQRADANASTPYPDRLLAGAHAVDIDRQFLQAAARILPRDAVYIVETGANTGVSTPLTLSTLPSYSLWLLLPRRQVRDTDPEAHPQYVLCFGCALPAGVQTLWTNGHGLVIGRFRA